MDAQAWWDPNLFGALFGGLFGGGVGTLTGLTGALAGQFAPRGQLRGLVLGLMALWIGVGAASALFGVYAMTQGQPWGIWFWPLYGGLLIAVINGGLLPVVRHRYREFDERKMRAEDFRQQ